jgi:hypothetical protein
MHFAAKPFAEHLANYTVAGKAHLKQKIPQKQAFIGSKQ